MDQVLLATLMKIAVQLSGYPAPAELPAVEFQRHAFFVQQACAGVECDVQGLYTGKGVVYIDERHGGERPNAVSKSIIIHELVHYLQHRTGAFDLSRCEFQLKSEMEAYAVQQRYLRRKQRAMPWDPVLAPRGCRK